MPVTLHPAGPPVAVLEPHPGGAASPYAHAKVRAQAGRLGFAAVIAFYLLYYFRPEDYFPQLAAIPLEKIAGGLAALALLGAVLAGRFRASREVKLFLAFLVLLCLAIPGAVWPGGAYTQVQGIAKCMLVVIATICMVDSLAKLRRILFIPALAMLFMVAVSFFQPRLDNRMFGLGNMFADPNYLALYLCMILPLCLYFGLTARSRLRKMLWAGGGMLALAGVVSTFSRGGFIALVATMLALAVMFRGKVRGSVVVLVLAGVIVMAAMPNSGYMRRLSTILHPGQDQTGSAQIRESLLRKSVRIALEHPLLGVGPGDFEIVSGSWHTSHNTYTELPAEAGIPALVVFLAILWQGFKNIRRIRAEQRTGETRDLAGALACSIIAYMAGAFFLSTAYWMEPYLWVACTMLLLKIGSSPGAQLEPSAAAAAGAPPC